MAFDFIQVNKSILDYSEYVRSVLLLKNYLKHRFIEVLLEEGFRLEQEQAKSYSELQAVFFSGKSDLEVSIAIRKRSKEQFT